MENILQYDERPMLYAPSTNAFWDDEYISQSMLDAHLDDASEGATRNHDFVKRSVEWIASLLPPAQYTRLLDLGCGPGIYAEQFQQKGYAVTGMDLSARSIAYAKGSAQDKGLEIDYICGNYLQMDAESSFDFATLIYCDYGVLPPESRKQLLANIHRALASGGKFLLDVFTPRHYSERLESKTWHTEKGDNGFWRATPYLCLESFYRYGNAFLTQYIIAQEQKVECYNIWEQTFSQQDLEQELHGAGFAVAGVYGDVAGRISTGGETLCILAEKK